MTLLKISKVIFFCLSLIQNLNDLVLEHLLPLIHYSILHFGSSYNGSQNACAET